MFKSFRNLLAVSAVSAALFSSSAHAFTVYAQAMVTPFQVTGQVMNSFPQALFCHIRVQGMRNDGFVVWGNASTVVYPGMTGFAYVYTSYPFQFVNGQAWADCNYGGYGVFHEDELEASSEWTE